MQGQPSARRIASGNVRLVKRKRGNIWYVQYRLPGDGRQVQKKLGPAWSGNGRPPEGYYTKRTAEAKLREILADAQRGVLPETVRTGATVKDAVEEWLRYVEHERGVRATTLREYRTSAQKHLLPEFGDRKLEAITTRSVETWKSRLLAEGKLSRRTINKLLTNLHGVFGRARRVYGLPKNPVDDVEKLRERYDPGDYDWLRPEEVLAVVRAAENASDVDPRIAEQDAAVILTAAFTGLRLGEILGLRWRDVDFDAEMLRVSQQLNDLGEISVTKGGLVRSVPMVDQVSQRLAKLSQRGWFTADDDPVLVGIARWRREVDEEGEPDEVEAISEYVDRSGFRKRYKAALKRAGVRSLRFHDLRHTMGTLASNHASARELQEWLGHADQRTTQRYTHYRSRAGEARRLAAAFKVETDLERALREAEAEAGT